MNSEEKIKTKIENLIDLKKNWEFSFSHFLNVFLALLIFVGTITISVLSVVKKIWAMTGFAVILIFLGIVFIPELKKRYANLEEIAKNIQDEYDLLLK